MEKEDQDTTKRKLWVAILFSILAPGLGQIYCGHLIRGIIFLGILTLLSFGKSFIVLLVMQQSSNPYVIIVIVCIMIILVYILAMVDAILLTRRYRVGFISKRYNKWYIYVAVFILAFLVIEPMTVHGYIAKAYIMPSECMLPTIEKGYGILVDNFLYNSNKACRGDIVVIKNPNDKKIKLVKRIIGLPGEIIEIDHKHVYINDRLLHEPYVVHKYPLRVFPRTYVPKDSFFVMGDNRDFSLHSRAWGFVSKDLIEGKVKVIYEKDGELIWMRIEKPFVFKSKSFEGLGREVPNLIGKSLSTAKRTIESSGFSVGRVIWEVNTDYSVGVVIRQNPKGGEKSGNRYIDMVVASRLIYWE